MLFALFLYGLASAASAQSVSGNLTALRLHTRPGDVVHVTDTTGGAFRWKLMDVPVDMLIGSAGLSDRDVKSVAIERADPAWNGTLIGLAAAGIPWLAVCAANDWCYYNEYGAENLLRTTAVVTTAIGAGLGALIDLSVRKRITIYEAPAGRPLSVLAAPVVSPSGTTVRLLIRF